MTYFCLECKKVHADGYKKHLKYKSAAIKTEAQDSRISIMEVQIERLYDKIEKIVEILKSWKMFIDRKHPYSYYYQPFFEEL